MLYLGLLASLMIILKIFLSFGPTLVPGVTVGGHPRGGFGGEFLRVEKKNSALIGILVIRQAIFDCKMAFFFCLDRQTFIRVYGIFGNGKNFFEF